jgi:predicted aspartyl protease
LICAWAGLAGLVHVVPCTWADAAGTGVDPADGVSATSADLARAYAIPTTLDRAGRVLAPVTINGQGPFRFILDTGANRSVLSPDLVEALAIAPSPDAQVEVHGVTGSAMLPTVVVGELKAGDLSIVRNKRMPVLSGSLLAGADGILGIEGMAGSRIEVDFESGMVTLTPSRRASAPEGMLTVPVTLRHRGLLLADARIGRVRIKAIIDTGAERTLGNMALFKALLPTLSPQVAAATVQGATPDVTAGASFLAPTIQVGDVQIENLEVTFGDLYVFRLWDLEKQPALLIGMDLIGTARRLVIDYRRREMQILP